MNWYWLLMLVCPIMMIWMMKGMHGDHKAGNSNNSHSLEQVTNELNELKERNNELHRQVENLQQKTACLKYGRGICLFFVFLHRF